MYPSLVLSAALVAPAAPVPRDTAPDTPGPAPRVLAPKADANGAVRVIGSIPTKVTVTQTHFVLENVVENGQQVQRQVQKQVEQDIVTSQYFNKTLAEFNGKFATADGTPLTADEATARVKAGAPLLASADGKPVARSWLRAAAPNTVVMIAEGLSHAQPQWGVGTMVASTPAPRLVMLGTDASGKLMAPCTSQPVSVNTAVYYDEAWEGGGLGGGRRVIRGFDGGYYGPVPSDAKVVYKPLAEVKFDAYDASGKLVSTAEVMKRLAAGGLVLVAGDNRLPDEAYLKGFREDVLVLIGADLVLPVQPVDQTRKKDAKADAKAQPVPAALPVAPAPPVLVKPVAIKIGGAVRPAPAPAKVEEKKAEEKKPEEKKPEEKK